jgi:hypothetical protein
MRSLPSTAGYIQTAIHSYTKSYINVFLKIPSCSKFVNKNIQIHTNKHNKTYILSPLIYRLIYKILYKTLNRLLYGLLYGILYGTYCKNVYFILIQKGGVLI